MTLFAADQPGAPRHPDHDVPPVEDESAGRPPRRRSVVVGWVLLGLGLVGVLILGFLPTPYVIERPGPVFDTLGEVTVGDQQRPLIDIPGQETYDTGGGSLDLLTVNIVGTREEPPSWVEVAVAWFDGSRAVVPLESVYPEGVTTEQSSEQSRIEMTNSQQEAIAAALRDLEYEVPGIVAVAGLVEGAPAEGIIEEGDEILEADGVRIQDVTQLREVIGEAGAGSDLDLLIRRDGEEMTVSVTPSVSEEDGTTPVIGIYTAARYDLPFDVEIQLENVGGPSAGMMFALGIIDKLTPGPLTGGEAIAGTGTIQADGTVGPIGGIRQKMHGAVGAGADWFLSPADNCAEVEGRVPDGLTVYAVATLDEALAAVDAIGSGEGREALPTCTAG